MVQAILFNFLGSPNGTMSLGDFVALFGQPSFIEMEPHTLYLIYRTQNTQYFELSIKINNPIKLTDVPIFMGFFADFATKPTTYQKHWRGLTTTMNYLNAVN
jgi:hypothetical protein